MSDEENLNIQTVEFEGPLDLLLDLIKTKKVDISKLSILDVINQFVEWTKKAVDVRLEQISDFVVMASQLVYLKSKILLPSSTEEKKEAEESLEEIEKKLKRLEKIREFSDQLSLIPRQGINWYKKETDEEEKKKVMNTTLYILLKMYSDEARWVQENKETIILKKPYELFTVEEAIKRLDLILKENIKISTLFEILRHLEKKDEMYLRSVIASSYVAMLEMVKNHGYEIKQFGPDIQISR